ncbi:MAG: hypothetical protein JNL92_14375 [Opitutaceae bacterium]|nr:hypothetical protein [Opitutaceae bacterium]
MKPRHGVLGLLLGGLCLLTAACSMEGPLSADPAVATRQVNQLVPRGSSETRATKALGDRGFALSRLSSDRAANHLVIATCTRGDRMWQVGLIVIDARVAATTVAITDLGAKSH